MLWYILQILPSAPRPSFPHGPEVLAAGGSQLIPPFFGRQGYISFLGPACFLSVWWVWKGERGCEGVGAWRPSSLLQLSRSERPFQLQRTCGMGWSLCCKYITVHLLPLPCPASLTPLYVLFLRLPYIPIPTRMQIFGSGTKSWHPLKPPQHLKPLRWGS